MSCKQHIRQLSYLLEVAPIASRPARVQCRASFCAQGRLKRRLIETRNLQTTAFQQQKPSARSGTNAKTRPSATGVLVSDTSAERNTIASATSTTSIQQDASVAAEAALGRLTQALADARQPLQIDRAVTEREATSSLRLCIDLAKSFNDGGGNGTITADSPIMKVLFLSSDLNGGLDKRTMVQQAIAMRKQAMKAIASTARAIVTDPKVFITPKILEHYVQFRTLIGRPDDLAEIFSLYATKLVPEPNSSPVRYTPATSDKASFAIPLQIAQHALDAAIATRNLPLCLDIIKESVCKTAFKRHKLIQQALLPFMGVALAPAAAYALASQFAVFQENLDTSTARWVGFAGIMSYIAFTGTIGMVALTTANDQMERVVWQDGTPLRERWLREQERHMLDQVAVAWGFKDPYRKGEEEGPEWEALKELISIRGMILDKIELMEGMQ